MSIVGNATAQGNMIAQNVEQQARLSALTVADLGKDRVNTVMGPAPRQQKI
jgi:hypothetical protein